MAAGTTARSVLRERLGEAVGGFWALTASANGTTTTIVDSTLANFAQNVDFFIGYWVYIKSATNSTIDNSIRRVVDSVVAGTLTFPSDDALAATTTSGDTFDLTRYNPDDIHSAINSALRDLYPILYLPVVNEDLTVSEGDYKYTIDSSIRELRRVSQQYGSASDPLFLPVHGAVRPDKLRLEGHGVLTQPTTDAGTTEVDGAQLELVVAKSAEQLFRMLGGRASGSERERHVERADYWLTEVDRLIERGAGMLPMPLEESDLWKTEEDASGYYIVLDRHDAGETVVPLYSVQEIANSERRRRDAIRRETERREAR